MGSANKVLVGTVVLQLVAEGRMRLDDSVEKWLPGLIRGTEYDGQKITVRHLLQHTAGISDDSFPTIETAEQYYENRYRVHTEEAIVQAGLRNKPTFKPGKGWDYSNTGYDLVGLIIKAVTGRAWHDEVDLRIVRAAAPTRTRTSRELIRRSTDRTRTATPGSARASTSTQPTGRRGCVQVATSRR